MKIIFLDIDGVLNSGKTVVRSPQGYIGIADNLVTKLRKIVKATGANIVLSSSWRESFLKQDLDGKYLKRKLGYKGLKIFSTTELPQHSDRGLEICHWLENNRNLGITHFCILDDEFIQIFDYHKLTPYLVHTDCTEGLTAELVKKAISILNR